MKKHVFIIFAALVAIVAAWMLLYPGKNPLTILKAKKATTPAATPGAGVDTTNGAFNPAKAAAAEPAGFPIYPDPHTYRRDIAAIQETLNATYGSSLLIDGYFGPKTLASLKAHGFAATDAISYNDFQLLLNLNL